MKTARSIQSRPIVVGLLTLTGILLGILLTFLIIWADYEATSYGFPRRAQAAFRGLRCPVFMSSNRSGTVSIKISNPTDRTISPSVWTQVSTAFEPDSKIDYIQLAPGEQASLQTMIGPENIDLGSFIFVDVLVYSMYPLPDRENTCGILVLPVNGELILIPGTSLSILFMGIGVWLSHKRNLLAIRSRSTLFMVIATILAMILGYMGLWFQAAILLILVILTLTITASSLFR